MNKKISNNGKHRTFVNLLEKGKILKEYILTKDKEMIMMKYGIGKSTFYKILKEKGMNKKEMKNTNKIFEEKNVLKRTSETDLIIEKVVLKNCETKCKKFEAGIFKEVGNLPKFEQGMQETDEILNIEELKSDEVLNAINPKFKVIRKGNLSSDNKFARNVIKFANDNLLPISPSLIIKKSKDYALKKGFNNFKGSSGWYNKLSQKFELKNKKIFGESSSADKNAAENFINDFKITRKNYQSENIFNLDESGLYYKMLPDRTVLYKKVEEKGKKINKERLTILFAVSLAGEKRKILIIGKSKKPISLRGKNITQLGLEYTHQKSSWMNSEIFKRYVENWNSELVKEKRKILLLMDNFAGHKIEEPTNIKFCFFTFKYYQPNTTTRPGDN
jgi:hypothetical protein